MSSDQPLKRLERMAYLSYHQDGLIDLFLGSAAFGFALQVATDSVVWNMFTWLPVILYVPLKNRITVPRLGFVSFGTTPLGRNRRLTWFLLLGLVVLLVWLVFMFPIITHADLPWISWIRSNELLFFGMVGALGFGLAGAISGVGRLYAYGALCISLLSAGQFFGVGLHIPILLLSAATVAVGITLLVRFMRKYPLDEPERYDEIG
jgi:hypothetical protein